jgi:hypothetical protein
VGRAATAFFAGLGTGFDFANGFDFVIGFAFATGFALAMAFALGFAIALPRAAIFGDRVFVIVLAAID